MCAGPFRHRPALDRLVSAIVTGDAAPAREPCRVRRVALLDEGWLQTSDLASALEASGFAVTVVTADGSSAHYRRRSVEWRSAPPLASASFLPCLDQLMRDAVFDRVLPLTESALYRLWDAGPAWADRIYPAVDDWQCRLLRDKHRMVEHLAARGVAVPRQRRLACHSAAAIARELGVPVVLKAATGSGGRHTWIVETRAELARAIDRTRRVGGAWAAQELLAGPTCLVGGVFDRGRPHRIYAAEKLEQHPARTGPAIRLRSDADPALIDLGLTVFRELRWTGFASADAIRLRRGSYVFLEVNPRPWGSIAAARSADVDLFAPFAALLAGDVPAADLAFAADRDCHVFPRYLLSPRYWRPHGALRALRDLLGPQGDDWRDAGFARHLAARLYRLHRRRVR
jgi:hypothetical protein